MLDKRNANRNAIFVIEVCRISEHVIWIFVQAQEGGDYDLGICPAHHARKLLLGHRDKQILDLVGCFVLVVLVEKCFDRESRARKDFMFLSIMHEWTPKAGFQQTDAQTVDVMLHGVTIFWAHALTRRVSVEVALPHHVAY